MRINRLHVMIILMGLLLVSCGSAAAPGVVAGKGGTLAGTCWELTQTSGTPVPAKSPADAIILSFDRATISGHTASNEQSGNYSTDGAKISWGNLTTTDVGDSSQSQIYWKALPSASSYTAANDQLTLYDVTGAAILEFKPASLSSCS